MCNYQRFQHYKGYFMKKFLMISLFFSFAISVCSEGLAPKEFTFFTRTDLELASLLRDGYKIRYNENLEIITLDEQVHFVDLAQRMQKCAQNPTDECNRFHLDEIEEALKLQPESETTKKLSGIIETLKTAKIVVKLEEGNPILDIIEKE